MKSPGQSNYQPDNPQPQVPASASVPYGQTAPANHQFQSWLPDDPNQTAQLSDQSRMLGMNGQPVDPNAQQPQGDLAAQVADLKTQIAKLLLSSAATPTERPEDRVQGYVDRRGGGYDSRGPGSGDGGNIGMGGRGSFF